MNKCQSKFERSEGMAFKEWDTVSQLKKISKGNDEKPDHENIPDQCVIVHNKEPFGVGDRAA